MMRNLLFFCTLILSIMLLVACSPSWEEYISENTGFAVQMPGDPNVDSGFERLSANSSLTTTTYTVTPLFSGESYLVYIGKYSNWSLGGVVFDMKQGKQGMRAAIEQQEGTITSEGPSELAGRDAWEYEIKVKGMEGSLRVFVEDMTIYGLQELHKEGKDASENAERFFTSFRLQ